MLDLLNLMYEGINNRKVGSPISAIVFNKELNSVVSSHNEKSNNRKSNIHHAEHQIIEELDKQKLKRNNSLILLITIPPCRKCFNEIIKSNYFSKIFYLIQEGQIHKEYINNKEILIEEFLPSNNDETEYVNKFKKMYFGYMSALYDKKWKKIKIDFNKNFNK